MWHYMIVNDLDGHDVPLDSGRREDFDGWSNAQQAYYKGLGARTENRLSYSLYKIITYMIYKPGVRRVEIIAKIEGIKENNTLPKDIKDVMDDILTDLKY